VTLTSSKHRSTIAVGSFRDGTKIVHVKAATSTGTKSAAGIRGLREAVARTQSGSGRKAGGRASRKS
jgi:hypothetical protein